MHNISLKILQTFNIWDVRDIEEPTGNNQRLILKWSQISVFSHSHHIHISTFLFFLPFDQDNFGVKIYVFYNLIFFCIAQQVFLDHPWCRMDRSFFRPGMSHQAYTVSWYICGHFFPCSSCLWVPHSTNPWAFLEDLWKQPVLKRILGSTKPCWSWADNSDFFSFALHNYYQRSRNNGNLI